MDEYTDYSCSTSLERLARDVETILRSWHVNDSDRHVSLADDTHEGSVASPLAGATSSSTSRSSLLALRSQTLNWDISFHSQQQQQRISHTVTLLLQLWDRKNATEASPRSPGSGSAVLPFSLIRPTKNASFGFNTFSDLFGIGQHLTLTPENADLTKIPADLVTELLGCIRCGGEDDDVPVYKLAATVAPDSSLSHQQHSIVLLVRNVLSSWLQTALNLSVSASHCAIPVFGIWTNAYGNQARSVTSSVVGLQYLTRHPDWMMMQKQKDELEWIQKCDCSGKRRFRRRRRHHKSRRPLVRTFWSPAVSGALYSPDTGTSASFICQWLPQQPQRFLWKWGDLLLAWGPCDRSALVAARYVYEWHAQSIYSSSARDGETDDAGIFGRWRPPFTTTTPALRHVLQVLQQAAGCNDSDNPLWGPPVTMDPIECLSAEIVWHNPGAALVQFPLKIRSKNFDQSDWMELQISLTSTLLNPASQCDLQLRTTYPTNIPATSMTATLRCCCAALIRAATLPPETLVSHLCDPELVLNWDNTAGNAVALALAQRGGTSPSTQALVAAMDWETAASEVLSEEDALQLVRNSVLNTELDEYSSPQFRQASPPGRLVSILSTHMTSLRSLCSMAVVWGVFCQELREQWEQRRSLSNLHDDVASKPASAPETMGAKSTNAGQLHSMEPNPDLSQCLIQQKLQVFNVCVECQNAIELNELQALEKQILTQELERSQSESLTSDEEFFDATDADEGNHFQSQANNSHPAVRATVLHVPDDPSTQRKGARCPVQGATLREANMQLFAPYLQRPLPLTDDIMAERRVMMARQRHYHVGTRLEIARRLQEPKLASDMQAFKAANPGSTLEDFLSWYGNPRNPMEEYMKGDSSSGTPISGFDNEDASVSSKSSYRRKGITLKPSQIETRQRVDKAAEAIRALEDTRQFWRRTWNAAEAIPAVEQQPLFDAAGTAERVFDFLETLHPASLLCQVMAVNFCTSFFVLTVSSGEAATLPIVQRSFRYLRTKIEDALRILSSNVLSSISGEEDQDSDLSACIVSVPAIAACEGACAAFSETEVLLSRSLSLLNKYPGRFDLIERILRSGSVDVWQPGDRESILELVEDLQRGVVPPGDCPEACIQDYWLQSVDSPIPCQLMVRYCSERDADGMQHGSLALATAKCTRE